jgi:L-amino acid N-acyltransferase YncA
MNIVACGAEHSRRLTELFGELSERDLTLIKEDLTDPEAVRGWAARPGQQWVALDGQDVVGYAAVRPLPEWSDHVGELRLVVDPARRRAGVGSALARHALIEAVRAGRRKLLSGRNRGRAAVAPRHCRCGGRGHAFGKVG